MCGGISCSSAQQHGTACGVAAVEELSVVQCELTLCIAAHSVLWQHCSSGMMCCVSLTVTSNLCSRWSAHLHSPKWPLLKLVVVASAALYSC